MCACKMTLKIIGVTKDYEILEEEKMDSMHEYICRN